MKYQNLNSLLNFLCEDKNSKINWIKYAENLYKEMEILEKEIHSAYKNNDPNAEDLDVKLTEKQEELENILSELEADDPEGDDSDKETSYGQEELMRQFASIYNQYINKIPFQGAALTKKQLLEYLRAWAQDYGWNLGGYKEETTDEQLLDAAEDSYKRYKYLKDRLK